MLRCWVKTCSLGGGGEALVAPFVKALKRLGFALVSKDVGNKMFITLVLRKEGGGKEGGGGGARDDKKIVWPELRACVYKKR